MLKRLALGLCSLAVTALAAGPASAGWFHNHFNKSGTVTVTYRQYNAFSPPCCDNQPAPDHGGGHRSHRLFGHFHKRHHDRCDGDVQCEGYTTHGGEVIVSERPLGTSAAAPPLASGGAIALAPNAANRTPIATTPVPPARAPQGIPPGAPVPPGHPYATPYGYFPQGVPGYGLPPQGVPGYGFAPQGVPGYGFAPQGGYTPPFTGYQGGYAPPPGAFGQYGSWPGSGMPGGR